MLHGSAGEEPDLEHGRSAAGSERAFDSARETRREPFGGIAVAEQVSTMGDRGGMNLPLLAPRVHPVLEVLGGDVVPEGSSL